jgi:hypothetical protein
LGPWITLNHMVDIENHISSTMWFSRSIIWLKVNHGHNRPYSTHAKSKSKCVSFVVIRIIRVFGISKQLRSRSSRTIDILLHVLPKQLRVIYLLYLLTN